LRRECFFIRLYLAAAQNLRAEFTNAPCTPRYVAQLSLYSSLTQFPCPGQTAKWIRAPVGVARFLLDSREDSNAIEDSRRPAGNPALGIKTRRARAARSRQPTAIARESAEESWGGEVIRSRGSTRLAREDVDSAAVAGVT